MDQLYVLFNFRSLDTEYDIGEIGNNLNIVLSINQQFVGHHREE